MKRADAVEVTLMLFGIALALAAGADTACADFVFGEPANMGPLINSPGIDACPVVTPDGLQLYISSDREGGVGEVDLWVSTRATTEDDWPEPVNLGESLNSETWDLGPAFSPDGLELYFCRGLGPEADLWVATRGLQDDPWGPPTNLGPTINDVTLDCGPCLMPDGLTLYFYSDRLGEIPGGDMWMTTRPTILDDWGPPVNLGAPTNTDTWDYWPHIAAEGLALLFCSDRDGTEDVWMARRPGISDPWGEPIKLAAPISTEAWDTCPFVSADGRTLYFVSDRDGGQGSYDLWQASIDPVVDLDGDGLVDRSDIDIMLDNWGTDDALCDIGPTPFGDGVVDVQDLIVLVEYMVEASVE